RGRLCCVWFFFFQAEDGIRDLYVTGVQTCALPISAVSPSSVFSRTPSGASPGTMWTTADITLGGGVKAERWTFIAILGAERHWRSEERRVGKECRVERWAGQ